MNSGESSRASDADAAAEELAEPLVLPEFSVSADGANGYLPSESITGTRIASRLIELPFNVSVAMSEMIEDFSLLELNDQIGFMSSTIPAEGRALPGSLQSSVTIRGYAADADLRDGFRRLGGMVDKVNVDRVEVIKGPVAGIYGRIQPGGVLNVISKKPGTKPFNQLSLSLGDYAQRRAELSSTGPVPNVDNLFYRVDLAAGYREYKMKYRETDTRSASAQLLWRDENIGTLRFELEYIFRREIPGYNAPLIVQRGVLDPYQIMPDGSPAPGINFFHSPAMNLLHFNTVGPRLWTDLQMGTVSVSYEKRLSPNWALRSGLNLFHRIEERQFLSDTSTISWPAGGEPDFSRIYTSTRFGPTNMAKYPDYNRQGEYGYNFQTDLLGSFTTGSLKHKLLITFDAGRQARRKREYQMFVAAANNPEHNAFALPLSVQDPNYFFKTFLDAPELYGARANQHYFNSDDSYGLFVSERTSFLDDRLIVMLGGRYDYVKSVRNLYAVPPGDLNGSLARGNEARYSEPTNHDVTYQLGVTYALARNTMLYANHSTSFQPISLIDNSGKSLPNETGEGYEAGIKVSWFDSRLNLTTGVYDIYRRNLARSVLIDVENNISDIFATGEERSKGFELDFNWQVSPDFQVFGGLGLNSTKITENDQQRFLINTSPRRTPDTNVGVGARYEVRDGRLKGLFLTAGVRHYGSSVALSTGTRTLDPSKYVVINARMPNGELIFPQFPEDTYIYHDVITVNGRQTVEVNSGVRVSVDNGQSAIENPAYTIGELAIGYRWHGGSISDRPVEHRVQVNVKNITDEDYVVASLRAGEPRSILLTYTMGY